MVLKDKVCTREQAIQLMNLGIFQPLESEEWQPGDIYSSLTSSSDDGYIFILGHQEDSPYKIYHPVKLYDCAELGAMLLSYNEAYYTKNNMWACGDLPGAFPTEAQAKANRLIQLLSDEILSATEINHLFNDRK